MIVDIETDDLRHPTKIHVVSAVADSRSSPVSFTDYDSMREFLSGLKYIVGHNFIRYDRRVIKDILGVDLQCRIYDTLPMSWVMFPDLQKHGLDEHGVRYKRPKPKVTDWSNQPIEVYVNRCEEDVKINVLLWEDLIKRFKLLYDDREGLDKYLRYLSFKMQAAAKAEDGGWYVDIDLVNESLEKITAEQDRKVEELRSYMPMVKKYENKTPPKKPYKKDGSLSSQGEKWRELCLEYGHSTDYQGEIRVVKNLETPNPNSPDQVKEWLLSLGWEPCTFDYKKNDDGTERQIPQIRVDGADGKELAPSVKLLIPNYPEVEILDGLTVLQHRRSIFEGIRDSLEYDEAGRPFVRALIGGLTNTLRFKHKAPLVNLPGVDKPWGKEIRGCLVAPEGYVTCGADMVSLESTTKKHFIYPFDPEYVKEMSQPGFDEHLDLAVRSGYLDKEDYDYYTSVSGRIGDNKKYIKDIRTKFKPVNYASVYGVRKKKLSRTTGMTEEEAQTLIDSYWRRNWAVLKFADSCEVKTIDGQMWVKNPVNNFWYTLRFKKDIFSTINQGTGAYCFDSWVAMYLKLGVDSLVGQFHDESANYVKVGEEEQHKRLLKEAIKKVNEVLNLNVKLDVDVNFGHRYSEVH